jgi:hypothetical protein
MYWGQERFMQGFGGETGRKQPLGKRRRRWVNNIKMDHKEGACGV